LIVLNFLSIASTIFHNFGIFFWTTLLVPFRNFFFGILPARRAGRFILFSAPDLHASPCNSEKSFSLFFIVHSCHDQINCRPASTKHRLEIRADYWLRSGPSFGCFFSDAICASPCATIGCDKRPAALFRPQPRSGFPRAEEKNFSLSSTFCGTSPVVLRIFFHAALRRSARLIRATRTEPDNFRAPPLGFFRTINLLEERVKKIFSGRKNILKYFPKI
jgi:hypothetical protein